MRHGQTGTRFYQIWCSMKQRCLYPKHNRFKSYGGRGIKICDEWLDFDKFYRDTHESYQKHCTKYGERNTTIDRIDSNGNYTKENCKWNTLWNQNLNRTNNHLITYNGETKPLTQWEREKGFKRGVIQSRLMRGWSIENTLNLPRHSVVKHRKLSKEHIEKIKKSMLKYFTK